MQKHKCTLAGITGVILLTVKISLFVSGSSGATPQSIGSPLDPRHWTHLARIGGYGL